MISKYQKLTLVLFIYFISPLFLNCNMIFYKKNEPFPNFSFIEDNTFAEIYLRWEEKIDHPLSGTTKKRNYQTEIYITQFKIEKDRLKKEYESSPIIFDFWIIPESVYVLNQDLILYLFLYGEKEQPYGIESYLGAYFLDSSLSKRKVSSSEVFKFVEAKYFLPSPDKEKIFVINKINKIQIYKILKNQIQLIQEKDLSFSYSGDRLVSWDPKNFQQLYLYNHEVVYVYNIINNSMSIAKTFPECINPGTSFGGSIDSNGNEIRFEQTKKEYYYIKLKNFKSFYQKNFIENSKFVKYSCYE